MLSDGVLRTTCGAKARPPLVTICYADSHHATGHAGHGTYH